MICFSIANIEHLKKVNELKPEMLELRYDLINEDPFIIHQAIAGNPKIIATCRPGKLDKENCKKILKKSVDLGADFIDLEFESDDLYITELINYAAGHAEIIISYHDFKGTPALDILERMLSECYTKGADIAKIACLVNEDFENANLLSLYSKAGRKVILGMGEKGKITRLAALKLGAEFTFVSFDESNRTAPGQLTYSDFEALNKILEAS